MTILLYAIMHYPLQTDYPKRFSDQNDKSLQFSVTKQMKIKAYSPTSRSILIPAGDDAVLIAEINRSLSQVKGQTHA